MKNSFLVSLLFYLYLSTANAVDIPALPPEPCYQNSCNEFMESVHFDFLNVGSTPTLEPAIYSGTCRHLGMYSPERDHYATVMLDQVSKIGIPSISTTRFSTILAFFFEKNEFANWDMEKGRQEMSSYWIEHGNLALENKTFRVVIPDENGTPVMIYWLRQNPITKEFYYIFYSGTAMRSFCKLQLNTNQ